MNLPDLLYWDVLTELVYDDLGMWEVAWRAHSLVDSVYREEDYRAATQAARDVIRRLVAEDLVVVVDRDNRRVVSDGDLEHVLSGVKWSSEKPSIHLLLVPNNGLTDRSRDIPSEASNLMRQAGNYRT